MAALSVYRTVLDPRGKLSLGSYRLQISHLICLNNILESFGCHRPVRFNSVAADKQDKSVKNFAKSVFVNNLQVDTKRSYCSKICLSFTNPNGNNLDQQEGNFLFS